MANTNTRLGWTVLFKSSQATNVDKLEAHFNSRINLLAEELRRLIQQRGIIQTNQQQQRPNPKDSSATTAEVRELPSKLKSLSEEVKTIRTSSNEVFKSFQSDLARATNQVKTMDGTLKLIRTARALEQRRPEIDTLDLEAKALNNKIE